MPHDGTGYWFHKKYHYGGKWFVGVYKWDVFYQHTFFVLIENETKKNFKRYWSYHEAKRNGWFKK